MNFIEEVKGLIGNNIETYKKSSDRFVADYNRELELTKEYNGRQLLELLQNADDASSEEVYIRWNKKESKLTISNQGTPFSIGGIKSLMIANLSSKIKTSFIGNKGLGFRSILNWAEGVTIKSNNCKISFTESIAKKVFENELGLSKGDKVQLRNNRGLSEEVIPFPVLAVPDIEEYENPDTWTTSIEILYRKKFEQDIELQLNEIGEEILLFLNTIEKITIELTDDNPQIRTLLSRKEKCNGYELVTIQGKEWKVFSKEEILPDKYQDKTKNEKQYYNLKVAFKEDLSDNYNKLFNFFPTEVSISLPCIIHGTFELNSSRNHLNTSDKNSFIIKELAELIKDCAIYLSAQGVDWRPYKLVNPLSATSDSKIINELYQKLATIRKEECLYPCINNKYNQLDDVFYYNEEFNTFFKNHFPQILPHLMIPLGGIIENRFNGKRFEYDDLVTKIDTLSTTGMSIELRAELIAVLADIGEPNKAHFSLLINESGHVISKNDLAFTPVIRSDKKFYIPKSVKVDFMNQELYNKLLKKIEEDFDKNEVARELQRYIKSVVNLQPYDSANVTEKIITGTKESIKETNSINGQSYIKEMVSALYSNFKNTQNKRDKLKIEIPLISRSNKITDATKLYFSNTYPKGEYTEIIYQGMLSDDDYLVPLDYWKLDDDIDSIELFFIWLGVNQFAKIEQIDLQKNRYEEEYIEFVFAHGPQKPDNFGINTISADSKVSKIERFDEIMKLPIHQIILLVLKDRIIRGLLDHNDEKINWFYVSSRPAIDPTYSYIQFQFYQSGLFNKYILDGISENLDNLINGNLQIDYEYFENMGYPKEKVKDALSKIGAKRTFMDLMPKDVYEILKTIPEKDTKKSGKGTATIYKMALDNLMKHEYSKNIPEGINLFSKMGDVEKYKPGGEIYYSDNSTLPKKILDTFPLLNLPKRVGENNVKTYLGVKLLQNLDLEIIQGKLKYNDQCNKVFINFFESIKPLILVYRLYSPTLRKNFSEDKNKIKEAKSLKNCRISIVTQCYYKFNDTKNDKKFNNVENTLEEKEFINKDNTFYFKESCIMNVDELKKDSIFCDAFAEMMCIVFKINELKNDFRQVFKNDITDSKHLISQDIGVDKLDEAYKLLGIPRDEIEFWENIFKQKEKILKDQIETDEILKQEILEKLAIELPPDYGEVDFDHFRNQAAYNLLESLYRELGLDPKDSLPPSKDLSKYHMMRFENCIKSLGNNVNNSLLLDLANKSSEQKNFISQLHKYNNEFITNFESIIDGNKYKLDVDYKSIIKIKIKEVFGFEVDEEPETDHSKNLYVDLLAKHEKEENDLPENIRSLLYFSENDEEIEGYIKKQKEEEQEQERKDHIDSNSTSFCGTMINVKLKKNEAKPLKLLHNSNNKQGVYTNQTDKNKKKKGKYAENLVYNTLINKYGENNVKWVSGNSTTPDKSDNKHYDIEYQIDSSTKWRLVEVKAISENQFILTAAEIQKGLDDPDIYEIALVKDEHIFLVKNIFNFENGETFNQNTKFTASPKDYILSFDPESIKTN